MSHVPAFASDSRPWLVPGAGWASALESVANNYWLNLAVVLVMTAFAVGYPVPTSNEWPYLFQLQVAGDSTILARDWTFAVPDARHFIFNAVFGPLTNWFPIAAFAWIARFVSWIAIVAGLFRLAQPFRIPIWSVTLAILLWLGHGQALVAEEWILGTFEAKSVAYPLLLWALAGFSRGRTILPALLLGASFSFHPAVGLWGGMAIGGSLFVGQFLDRVETRRNWGQLYAALICVVITGLPGLLPLLNAAGHDTYTDVEFQCLSWMPIHLDPSSWSPRLILTCYILLAFNALECGGTRRNRQTDFLLWFQVWTAIAFTAGLLAFAFGRYDFVILMPFRLFPVFVLLFFFMHLFRACYRQPAGIGRATVVVGVLGLSCLNSPVTGWSYQASRNLNFWSQSPQPYETALNWIAAETPADSIIVAPPSWRESYRIAQRPLVANWWICPAGRATEWRERLAALTGFAPTEIPERATLDELEAGFTELAQSDINKLRDRYGGDYLVSRGDYDWPMAFEADGYRVYRINGLRHRSPDIFEETSWPAFDRF